MVPDAKTLAKWMVPTAASFYDIPNLRTGYTGVNFNINRGWLRSVDICINMKVESFVDEIATRLKKILRRSSRCWKQPEFQTGTDPAPR